MTGSTPADAIAHAINGSAWLYPTANVLHVLGMALVVGPGEGAGGVAEQRRQRPAAAVHRRHHVPRQGGAVQHDERPRRPRAAAVDGARH